MCIVNEKQQALLHALRALNVVFFHFDTFLCPVLFKKKKKKRRKKTKFKVLCVSTEPLNFTPLPKFKTLFCQFFIFVLLVLSTTSNDLFCSCKVDVTNLLN